MQISSTGMSALPPSTSGQANSRLLATDLTNQLVPTVPITATVKSVTNNQAVLDLGSSTMLIRLTDDSIKQGDTITVRFQENGKGIVDLGDGRTTAVLLETGPASVPVQPKQQAIPPKSMSGLAVYTPIARPNETPRFSQPVIRVEVLSPEEAKAYLATIPPAESQELDQNNNETSETSPKPKGFSEDEGSQKQSARTTQPNVLRQLTGNVQSSQQSNQQVRPSLTKLQPGETLVRSEGRVFVARFSDPTPDTSAGPVFMSVTTTPRGIVLSPTPDTPISQNQIATSLVRASITRPEIGEIVQNLLNPSQTTNNPKEGGLAESQVSATPQALKSLTDLLTTLLPKNGQPPDAGQISEFVKHGGLLYESKLAQAAVQKASTKEVGQIAVDDVKGQVLRALKETGATSEVDSSLPLHQALDSIESQQALNVLSAQTGEGIRLQLPIWDQTHWRTMDITIKPDLPEQNGGNHKTSDGYDILMHTDLTDFGETYIDVQAHSNSFRAILYIQQDNARTAAKSALGELNQEVRTLGYTQVFVDVRSVSELPIRTRDQAHALKAGVPSGMTMLDVRV